MRCDVRRLWPGWWLRARAVAFSDSIFKRTAAAAVKSRNFLLHQSSSATTFTRISRGLIALWQHFRLPLAAILRLFYVSLFHFLLISDEAHLSCGPSAQRLHSVSIIKQKVFSLPQKALAQRLIELLNHQQSIYNNAPFAVCAIRDHRTTHFRRLPSCAWRESNSFSL